MTSYFGETGRDMTVGFPQNKGQQEDEYTLEVYYEQKLRNVFFDNVNNGDGTISNQDEWDCLIAMFLKNRLVSIEDVKKLEANRPCFPMTFDVLVNTITQAFGDQSIKDLGSSIIESKEQLENCRTYINMLNIKSLSANELYQLATILNTCMKKSKEAEKNLSQVVDKVKNLSEDSFSFVWDKIPAEYHNLSTITSPYQTALQEKASIEKEFNDRKVRAVHYRK